MATWVVIVLAIVGAVVACVLIIFLCLAYAVKKGVESDGSVYDDVENRVSLLEADVGRVLERLGMTSVTEEGEEAAPDDTLGAPPED